MAERHRARCVHASGAMDSHGESRQPPTFTLRRAVYELLFGRKPFELDPSTPRVGGLKAAEFKRMHLNETPPHPREFRPDLPQRLVELMLRCLSKEASSRPASFAEVYEP